MSIFYEQEDHEDKSGQGPMSGGQTASAGWLGWGLQSLEEAVEPLRKSCSNVLTLALRTRPVRPLNWALRVGGGVGGLVRGRPGLRSIIHLAQLESGSQRHLYPTDPLPIVSTPPSCWETPACAPGSCGPVRRYNESIKNCILEKM